MLVNGFLLQSTYRIESGRSVIHLHGVLEDGRSFLVRDGRVPPHFFVRTRDRETVQECGAGTLHPTSWRAFRGEEDVLRVEAKSPSELVAVRERFGRLGGVSFEADVRYGVRYLIDRGVRGSLVVEGEPHEHSTSRRLVFDEPRVGPGSWTPELRVLSLDIETDPRAERLLAISLYGCGAEEVLLLSPGGEDLPPTAVGCGSERELLEKLVSRVAELDPDVLTGWNVVDFDFAVLLRIAEKAGIGLELGRGGGEARLLLPRSRRELTRASIPGRVVLDGIQLFRGAFIRMESYALDAVAREVLGEGKTLSGRGRGEEILRLFREDREAFVEYSLTDARLVAEILEEKRLIELTVARSCLTGMTLDRVTASIASFDFLYLRELRRRGFVAPSVGAVESEAVSTAGGYVMEPTPGLFRNVLALDFKSLYPSLIRTFQIDPLGYVEQDGNEDLETTRSSEVPGVGRKLIRAPNGALFRREQGILTGMLDELFPQREVAKRSGDSIKSHAIKILMNSFYGVLGSSACRFHNPHLANAITSFGKALLLWSRERIESFGHPVLYGDTDSLFVETRTEDAETARALGRKLVDRLNRDLADFIRAQWGVESRLELEFEALYLRLVLMETRRGVGGARKRYAGLVEVGEKKEEVVFTGMEAVRRDWTDLAKRVQLDLYERLFSDRPVEDYLRDVLGRLRRGELDSLLIYRKGLGKSLDAYTSTTPPHVAAARKMTKPSGRVVRYAMTTAGPEPATERKNPFDYSHYIAKQIRPVAEPVLSLMGLDFDGIVTGQTQLRLF